MTAGSAPGRAADRVRTIFLGSGSFAVPIFEAVVAHPRIELVGVVTAPDRPAGRGKLLRPTPVALKARATWAPLLQPARLRADDAIEAVAKLRPELGVLADFGQIVSVDRIMETLAANPGTKIVSVVQAETSTGAEFPVAELAEALRASGSEALLYVDCVTSLGGQQVEAEAWGIDYGYSCSQKALGCPPGIAPVTISERAVVAMQRHGGPVPYYYDFEELSKYWIDRPITYHHTLPILQYYALYEGIRLALEEGLEARWERNADAGRYFQDEIRARGYDLLADPAHQLVQLSAVKVPEGIDGKEAQLRFLREHGIEIGGGLGPKAPPIWRVGLMGVNANRETADRVLAAFDAVLPG